MKPPTTEPPDEDDRPYSLWDEESTKDEFRRALAIAHPAERPRLIGKLMRELRDPEVWTFTTPAEVRANF
jgi:hypothetical protein